MLVLGKVEGEVTWFSNSQTTGIFMCQQLGNLLLLPDSNALRVAMTVDEARRKCSKVASALSTNVLLMEQ